MRQVVEGDSRGGFCSALTDASSLRVFYHMGEWAIPRLEGSYLYAFVSLNDARQFIREVIFGIHAVILVCEAETVELTPYIYDLPWRVQEIVEWWKEKMLTTHPYAWEHGSRLAPDGTVWCTKVRPTMEVLNV